MKVTTRIFSILLVLAMVLSLAACGNSGNAPANGTEPTGPSASTGTPANNPSAGASSGSTKDTLHIALSKNVTALDAFTGNMLSFNLSFLIFDTLTKQNPETMELEPCLATSWERVDDYTWRFYLRDDVTFSNGEKFSAESAAYTINYLHDLGQSYQNYRQWGLGYPPEGKVDPDNENALLITTPRPLISLPYLLMRIVMLPIEASQQEGFAQHPIGSGPYLLTGWEPGLKITMEANDNYWGDAPHIRYLDMDIVTDDTARTTAVQSGEYDIVYNVPFDTAESMESGSLKTDMNLLKTDSLAINVLYFNGASENKFIQDPQFRKALQYAIDPYEICEYIMGNMVEPNNNVHVANLIGGYETEGYPHKDVDKCKELLAECGYDGSEISIIMTSEEFANNADVVEYVMQEMQAAGVNMVINEMDNASYKAIKNGPGFDIASNNYSGYTGDTEHYYLQGIKNTNWAFPEAEEIIDKIYSPGVTEEQRYELLSELMRVCWENSPYLFCASNVNLFAARDDVAGITVVPQNSFPLLSEVYFTN